MNLRSVLPLILVIAVASGCATAEPDAFESLVTVVARAENRNRFGWPAIVFRVEGDYAYLVTRYGGLGKTAEAPENPPDYELIAAHGSPNNPRLVRLEFIYDNFPNYYSILRGPRAQLPAAVARSRLPELKVGDELSFVGIEPVKFADRPFETLELRPKVTHLIQHEVRTLGVETSWVGLHGFYHRDKKIIGYSNDSSAGRHTTLHQTAGLYAFDVGLFQMGRVRASRPAPGEVQLDFALRYIQLFDLDPREKGKLFVAHRKEEDRNKSIHQLDSRKAHDNGPWTEVPLQKHDDVDAEFEFPAAPHPSCRPVYLHGSYRFDEADGMPVWYDIAATSRGNGIIALGGDGSWPRLLDLGGDRLP